MSGRLKARKNEVSLYLANFIDSSDFPEKLSLA